MNADQEESPEERFQVVHKGVRITKECNDGHENLGSALARSAGGLVITYLDGKIEIDEEAVVIFLYKHDAANRYVSEEHSRIQ